jgi:hypothetical protein
MTDNQAADYLQQQRQLLFKTALLHKSNSKQIFPISAFT